MTSSRVLEGYVRALQGFLHIKSFLNCSFIAQKWCFGCKDILIFKLQFVQFIDMYSIVHALCMFGASKLLYATLDFVSAFLHMTVDISDFGCRSCRWFYPLEWTKVRLRRHPWVSNYSKPAKACAPCKSGGVASETPWWGGRFGVYRVSFKGMSSNKNTISWCNVNIPQLGTRYQSQIFRC